jgi:hypothetical protein
MTWSWFTYPIAVWLRWVLTDLIAGRIDAA